MYVIVDSVPTCILSFSFQLISSLSLYTRFDGIYENGAEIGSAGGIHALNSDLQ
jgi:hypothetical protein